MAAITLKVDDKVYENAKALYAFLGTDLESELIELIERAASDEYPRYEHIEPNEETIAAMQECEDILNGSIDVRGYTDIDEMFREILSEEED